MIQQKVNHVPDTWPIVVSPPHRKSWPAWTTTTSGEPKKNIHAAFVPCLRKCSWCFLSTWHGRREDNSIERVETTPTTTTTTLKSSCVDERIEEEPNPTSRSRLLLRARGDAGERRWEEEEDAGGGRACWRHKERRGVGTCVKAMSSRFMTLPRTRNFNSGLTTTQAQRTIPKVSRLETTNTGWSSLPRHGNGLYRITSQRHPECCPACLDIFNVASMAGGLFPRRLTTPATTKSTTFLSSDPISSRHASNRRCRTCRF